VKVYYTLPQPSLKPSPSLEIYMTNVLALITLLTVGGLIVIAPLYLILFYKFWKENKDDTRNY
jgi:hypothetical protein